MLAPVLKFEAGTVVEEVCGRGLTPPGLPELYLIPNPAPPIPVTDPGGAELTKCEGEPCVCVGARGCGKTLACTGLGKLFWDTSTSEGVLFSV